MTDGLAVIGAAMFQYSGVTSIAIPSSVTSIGMGALYDCDNLGSVTLSSGLTVIGESMFEGCDALSSVTIPSSVTSIGTLAFSECSTLNSVTLSDGLTVLGTYMFYNCDSLDSVAIPSSITSIGEFAFGNCGNLGSVMLSDGLGTIGNAMFEKCTALASITIPSSMTSIGNDAFESCSALQKAVIYSKTATFGTNVFASTAMPLDGIYGFTGSTAEAYAASNQIPFHAYLEVTYDSQGGSAVPFGTVKQSGQKVDPPDDPTLEGNVFGGWYKEADCINEWDFDTDTVTADITLFAKWTKLTLRSSDADGIIYTGGRITLTPSVDGGEWDWDEEYFSASFNSPATFTALKEGISTVTYTVDGVSVTYDVTIEESELPQTGQNYMLLYGFIGGGVLCIAGATLMAKKRRGRA